MTLSDIEAGIAQVGFEPFHRDDDGLIYCGDCLEVMKGIPDGAVDLVLTDPPYGINLNVQQRWNAPRHVKQLRTQYDSVQGDNKPFVFGKYYRPQLCKEQYWWGANNYCQSLPDGGSWLVWDRKLPQQADVPGSDFELCWSQQKHSYKIIRIMWTGYQAKERDEERKHPTQKPVSLMARLISRHSNPADIILDPFLGSGTTLVAAKQLGRKYIGIEISKDYCDIAVDRLRQRELFNQGA